MPESTATPRGGARGGPDAGSAWQIRRFPSIDSTNRYLLDEARNGAPDRVVAVADHQTAGRGRLGRTWESRPDAALLVSVLLRPVLAADRVGLVTTAAGLALADAVRAVAGVAPAVKWPNDLVVGDRKLAGILSEADLAGATVRAVVIGAGCNLRADAYPPALADQATCCESEAGAPVDRNVLLTAFLDALDRWIPEIGRDPDVVVASARARSATLGRRVRVDRGGDEPLVGDAVGLAADGALVVRDRAGRDTLVAVGDVVHLRAVD